MKAVILYSQDQESPEHSPVQLPGGGCIYVRSEVVEDDPAFALDNAEPREGETVLNAVPLPEDELSAPFKLYRVTVRAGASGDKSFYVVAKSSSGAEEAVHVHVAQYNQKRTCHLFEVLAQEPGHPGQLLTLLLPSALTKSEPLEPSEEESKMSLLLRVVDDTASDDDFERYGRLLGEDANFQRVAELCLEGRAWVKESDDRL